MLKSYNMNKENIWNTMEKEFPNGFIKDTTEDMVYIKFEEIEPSKLDDEILIELKEEAIGILTAGKGNELDILISNLLEIERELTLREDK